MTGRKGPAQTQGAADSAAQSGVLSTDDLSRLYVIAVFVRQKNYEAARALVDQSLSPIARQVAEHLTEEHGTPANALVAKVAEDMRQAADAAVQRSRRRFSFRGLNGEIRHTGNSAAQTLRGSTAPSQIYVEHRDDGTYAVMRPNAQRASAIRETQQDAIKAARDMFPDFKVTVSRVRRTKSGAADQWRKA